MAAGTVAGQFPALMEAARGCDRIVGATALQLAAPSVAESLGIPYTFVAYCPIILPSPHHDPPPLSTGSPPGDAADSTGRWTADAERWNANFLEPLNEQRAALDLAPLDDVRSHVLTDAPWLAADPYLAPWSQAEDPVFQPGAWIVEDERPLPRELEAFLEAGDAPAYFGLGSMRSAADVVGEMVKAVRRLGRRMVLLRGWADLDLPDDADDCIAVGEVNQQALFPRVTAAVHHGGAGTTTAAARAGIPQLIIPRLYDQHYWAERVEALGIGAAHAPVAPSAESLQAGLSELLRASIAERAREVGSRVRTDGARLAAQRLADREPASA